MLRVNIQVSDGSTIEQSKGSRIWIYLILGSSGGLLRGIHRLSLSPKKGLQPLGRVRHFVAFDMVFVLKVCILTSFAMFKTVTKRVFDDKEQVHEV